MSRRADPGAGLLRLLAARTRGVIVARGETMPWASVTFSGARHSFVASGDDATIDRFAENLNCDEFALPGHIVAEIVVATRTTGALTIEALTVEVD